MLRNSNKKIQFYIFFAMMWVFYSLNSRYFQVPRADMVRWIVMALLIGSVLISNRWKIKRPPLLVGAFVVAAIPSLLASIDLNESIVKMICFIVVVYGGYIYFSSLESEQEFEIAMKIMMGVMIAFEIQSVLAIILGFGYGSGGGRATGITTNANTLGGYSNLALLASYYWSTRTKGIKKCVYIILMGCSIWTCFLSGSRGGVAVLMLMTFFMLMFRIKNTLLKGIILIAMVILVKVIFLGGLSFLGIEALNRLAEEGGMGRGELWEFGMNVWRRYPMFGCGYSVSNLYNTMEGMKGFDFHNSYITILAELGVFGGGILGITTLTTFVNAISVLKYEIKNRAINLFLICCLMMITQLIAAYSESFLFAVGSTEACTFWMLFTWNMAYQEFCFRQY